MSTHTIENPIIPSTPHFHFRHLFEPHAGHSDLKNYFDYHHLAQHVQLITHASQILESKPFTATDGRPIAVSSDLDGVYNLFLLPNSHGQYVMDCIANRAKHLDIWSARIIIDPSTHPILRPLAQAVNSFEDRFPHYQYFAATQEKIDSFVKMLRNANNECRVTPHIGFNKILQGHKMKEQYTKRQLELLEKDCDVALIISSMFDRAYIRHLLKETPTEYLNQLYIFDTGKILQ